jgi:3-hydroxyisobutyrate dehydrogenase
MRAVTVLGLGTMGSGMASRLLAAGFPVTVWNRSAERAREMEASGARVAATPRTAVAGADVVVSMVADDAASGDVWLGEDGALAGVRKGAVLIESSTISPDWVQELAAHARVHGCELIDAPVTGSRTQAQSGELLFLAGGDPAAIEGVRDVLLAMGREVVRLGPTGSGAFVKLVNNFVCGVQVAAIAEAVALIEASGLSRAEALGVLLNGAPGSPLVKAVAARMIAGDYDVHFRVDLMAKDLAYAIRLAAQSAVPLRTAEGALDCFREASRQAFGDRDIAAVVEPLRASGSERAAANAVIP